VQIMSLFDSFCAVANGVSRIIRRLTVLGRTECGSIAWFCGYLSVTVFFAP
jgi:hypothetical protein